MGKRIGYLDHLSLAVPDVQAQVDFFRQSMGMTELRRGDDFGLVVEPHSGFRIETTRSEGGAETKLLHIGFEVADVGQAYGALTASGLQTVHAPHRRERANIDAAFVKDAGGLEIQLSKPFNP
jgi:catechol 2,3-dioxygenase-like lactoylglutathione lyase family enzyme